MKNKRVYQEIQNKDLGCRLTLDMKVSDLKILYNLLEDQHADMIVYKEIQSEILQVLKDYQFEKELNDLPF